MSLKIKLGCDPELFLKSVETGELVSAHDILPGTKIEPYKVTRGAIQVDGTAAEFNTDPAESGQGFVNNIAQVMADLKKHLGGKYEFVLDPTATFEPTYFHSLPDVTRELGCNPDFNAWTGKVNPSPDGDSTTMRTASGHIHIGWCDGVNPSDPNHIADCETVIKQMDYFLGLYSLMWDKDPARRALYGKAGAHRRKPYGAEYRTMSNVWLRSQSVQRWIWDAAVQGVNNLMSGGASMEDQFGDFAQKAIDNNDTEWFKSTTGKKIHMAAMLPWPDVNSCKKLDKAAVESEEEKKLSAYKKTKAGHTYRKKTLPIGLSPTQSIDWNSISQATASWADFNNN